LQPVTLPYTFAKTSNNGTGVIGRRKFSIPPEINTFDKILPQADFLLAAFSAYLYRLINMSSFDIGYTDTSLQSSVQEIEETFVKSIPLHIDLDPEQPFEKYQRNVQEKLKRIRTCWTNIGDVLINHPSLRSSLEDFENNTSISVVRANSMEDFDSFITKGITLIFPENGTDCTCFYDSSVLGEDSISRLLHHFSVFLRGILSGPSCRIRKLPLLDETNRHRLLYEFNDTKHDHPKDKLLNEMFEE
jgi:hypothetical protein